MPAGNAPQRGGLAALGPKRLATLAGGVVALIAVIAVAVMWGRSTDYRVLFANLGDRDGGSVVAARIAWRKTPHCSRVGGSLAVSAKPRR